MCGETDSALDALEKTPKAAPDLIIADVTMEGMSGIEFIKHLQSRHPELPVLVIPMHDEVLYADRTLRAGARGYLMKSEAAQQVVAAIRRILKGDLYVSEAMSDRMLKQHIDHYGERPPNPVSSQTAFHRRGSYSVLVVQSTIRA